MNSLHLGAKNKLHIIVECHLLKGFRCGCGESFAVFLVPRSMSFPLREIRRTVRVAQITVLSIRHQPLTGLCKEVFKRFRGKDSIPFLFEDYPQIAQLCCDDSLIVYLQQCVQFLSQRFQLLFNLFVSHFWQLSEISIKRMECENRNATVWITVRPLVSLRGIVDGQDLQHALARQRNPIYHLSQVTEIAYAKTRF